MDLILEGYFSTETFLYFTDPTLVILHNRLHRLYRFGREQYQFRSKILGFQIFSMNAFDCFSSWTKRKMIFGWLIGGATKPFQHFWLRSSKSASFSNFLRF